MKRVGIVGTGYIARYHRGAIDLIPDAELVAVCDVNLTQAQQFAGIGIDAYGSLGEMLNEANLDCMHVCTPPASHAVIAREGIQAGVHVYVEKPLAVTASECAALVDLAGQQNVSLAVSHNFLFARPYVQLRTDIASGRFGPIDQIDVIWQKPMDFRSLAGSWMVAHPANPVFETGPHLMTAALDLSGEVTGLQVDYSDPVALDDGGQAFRRWEIRAVSGNTHVRLLVSFADGFTQHYINLRGRTGGASVDFERNTYTPLEHRHAQLDIDRFFITTGTSVRSLVQGLGTLIDLVRARSRHSSGGPFFSSVHDAIAAFYRSLSGPMDSRIDPQMGLRAIEALEHIARDVTVEPPVRRNPAVFSGSAPEIRPRVLVTGGTGFIGRALVEKLCQAGHQVRVLSRRISAEHSFGDGVEVVEGDTRDPDAITAALAGIEFVFHLARGDGSTWRDFELTDLQPTRMLADTCTDRGVFLIYASSIAVHCASDPRIVIRDQTPPHEASIRSSLYARCKAEAEGLLEELRQKQGLGYVVVRPGIVVGAGASPLHPGVGEFPYSLGLCVVTGRGDSLLPIVLVEDCATAMLRVMETQMAGGELSGRAFNLVDDPMLTANDYLRELEKATSVKIKTIHISPWRAWLLESMKFVIKRLAGNADAALPSYEAIKGRGYLSTYDNTYARSTLDWSPASDRYRIIEVGIHRPAV